MAHDGSDAVLAEFPHTVNPYGKDGVMHPSPNGRSPMFGVDKRDTGLRIGDEGNVARYFYCAKPSPREKEAGLDGFNADLKPAIKRKVEAELTMTTCTTGYTCGGTTPRRNTHATVKPIALMQWLIRLVTPPGGTVLDPFLGSGTTAIAAVLEGRPWIGVEREDEYAAIAQARIDWWTARRERWPGKSVAEILKVVPKTAAKPSATADLFA